jgi:hypothetical protein
MVNATAKAFPQLQFTARPVNTSVLFDFSSLVQRLGHHFLLDFHHLLPNGCCIPCEANKGLERPFYGIACRFKLRDRSAPASYGHPSNHGRPYPKFRRGEFRTLTVNEGTGSYLTHRYMVALIVNNLVLSLQMVPVPPLALCEIQPPRPSAHTVPPLSAPQRRRNISRTMRSSLPRPQQVPSCTLR